MRQIGVVDDSGEGQSARRLDLPHDLQRLLRGFSQRAAGVGHKGHPVVPLLQDEGRVPAQGVGPPVVAADVHHRVQAPVLHQPVGLRRQGGQVHVGVGELGGDERHPRRLQLPGAVLGAEVGVDDVQVGDCRLFPLPRQEQGVIYPLVFSFAIPSNVKIPVEGETEDFSWVDEGTDGKNSDDTIGSVSLTALELIKNIEITAHLEAMSIDAFESFIVKLLARKARRAIDNAIINGKGTKEALGILTAKTKANEVSTIAGADWSYDDIIDLKRSLKSGYRQNAKFVMSSTTLGMVEKIKDKNDRPIFKDESDNGTQKLSGKPVIEYDNVPDGVIIFGDFEYYYFNFVKNFEIAKDTSVGFKSAKVCYRALALCDGKPALNEAFVVKKKSQ